MIGAEAVVAVTASDLCLGSPVRSLIVGGRAVVAVLLIGVSASCGVGGHSESWEYGYKHSDAAAQLVGHGTSAEYACKQVAIIGTSWGGNLNSGEIIAGCRAALKERGY